MALEAVVKLTKEQYEILANGGTVGPYTGIDNTKYLYFVQDDVSAGSSTRPVYFLNGSPVACAHSLEADVPSDADFNNYYHKTGSWNGLTYTAGKVGSPDDLSFTIPTGTTSTTVALGNHNHDGTYLKLTGGNVTGPIQVTLNSGNHGEFKATRGNYSLWFGIGSGDVNRGIFDDTNSDWMIYRDASTNVYINGAIYENGTALSSKYLALAGGTMTGVLALKGDQYFSSNSVYGMDANNSDIVNVNSIYTMDLADTTAEGIRFYRDSTHWDSFTISGGVMYFMANDSKTGSSLSSANVVLHSGNYSSYAISKTLTSAKGDIIYASAANTPARLPIGSEGQVLKVSGGVPVWGTDTNSNQTVKVGNTTFGANAVVGFIAGNNVDSIVADTTNNTITINTHDTTYNEATTAAAGLMSAADKNKLNGIAAGAEVNVQSDWNEANTSSDAYIKNKPSVPTVYLKNASVNGNTLTITKQDNTTVTYNPITEIMTAFDEDVMEAFFDDNYPSFIKLVDDGHGNPRFEFDTTNYSVVSGANDGTNWTSITINGVTKNIPSGGGGTVTSVAAGTGLSISGTASVNPTVNIASGYKLPTTTEWNNKSNKIYRHTITVEGTLDGFYYMFSYISSSSIQVTTPSLLYNLIANNQTITTSVKYKYGVGGMVYDENNDMQYPLLAVGVYKPTKISSKIAFSILPDDWTHWTKEYAVEDDSLRINSDDVEPISNTML